MEGVVVSNIALREHEVEQFEDDPLEYIRMDLALSSTGLDSGSRRLAAADVLRSLVGGGYEIDTTEIVGSFINTDLQAYRSNPAENWKAKDSAVFMMTAVASKGSTTKVRSWLQKMYSMLMPCDSMVSLQSTPLWMLSNSSLSMSFKTSKRRTAQYIPSYK